MTDSRPAEPRPIGQDDPDALESVVEVLTAAFTGDPLMSWLFPGTAAHVRSLRSWWELIMSMQRSGSELWLGPDAATAAMWRVPVFDEPESDTAAQNRFVEVVSGLVEERTGEVLSFFGQIGDAHPTEPHWYLGAVGTRPDRQGTGGGAVTLAPVLARCDAEGLPAYLESSNPRNLAFYHRLGFDETGTLTTPDGAATMTFMWRTPRVSGSLASLRSPEFPRGAADAAPFSVCRSST